MILGIVVCLAFGLKVALRRPLRDVGNIRIRWQGILLSTLALLGVFPPLAHLIHGDRSCQLALWIAVMAVLLACCVVNLRTPGFPILTAGVLCNLAVITANGGMPVVDSAVVAAGGHAGKAGADIFHLLSVEAPRLSVLADVLPLPGLRGLRGVLSVGDVLMLIGTAAVIVAAGQARQASVERARCH